MPRVLVRCRAVLLGSLATAVAVLLVRLATAELALAADLVTSGGAGQAGEVLDRSFTVLLTGLAAVALAVATGWGWAVTLVVVAEVVARPSVAGDRRVRGVPRPVQRALLAACGATLAAGLALPAHADPGTAGVGSPPSPGTGAALLTGLPLPTRATAGDPTATAATPDIHVVRPGESLWSIAADRLPADASDLQITAAWQAVHRANRAVVGPDPDLVHPAQRLRLPRR